MNTMRFTKRTYTRFVRHHIRTFVMKNICLMFLMFPFILGGCEHQNLIGVLTTDVKANVICFNTPRVLNVGFYAYFSPVSYSANASPNAVGFSTHLGYEADLLTALESMDGVNLSFTHKPISEWSDIWHKAAEPEYDLIAGGNYHLGRSHTRRSREHHRHIYAWTYTV